MKLLSRKLFEASVKDLFNDVHHGDIDLMDSDLTELPKDLPDEITGYFDCSWNQLTNLIGSPEIIHGNFICTANHLESLEGCPKQVDGDFMYKLTGKGKHFTEEEIRAVCKVGGKIVI